MTRNLSQWLLTFLVLPLLVVLLVPYQPSDSLFLQDLQNAGHILVFGILSLALLALLSANAAFAGLSRPYQYLVVIVITVVLGAGSEILQVYIPGRSPEAGDVGRDIAGSLSFLGINALFDRKLVFRNTPPSWQVRTGLFIFSLLVFLAGLGSAMLVHLDYYRAFPSLLDFHSEKMMQGVIAKGIRYSPARDALELQVKKGTRWPFIRISNLVADWRGYSRIVIDLHSPGSTPVNYTLLLDDRTISRAKPHSLRYHGILLPGTNRLRIPITPNRESTLELKHMRMVWLAFPQPQQNYTLRLYSIRLE